MLEDMVFKLFGAQLLPSCFGLANYKRSYRSIHTLSLPVDEQGDDEFPTFVSLLQVVVAFSVMWCGDATENNACCHVVSYEMATLLTPTVFLHTIKLLVDKAQMKYSLKCVMGLGRDDN